MSDVVRGPDGVARCRWSGAAPDFLDYHDKEWGFPVGDDRRLFEKLALETFQSGLSWRTILSKRDNFRAAFSHFDIDRVARFGKRDVERLLGNQGIVRNRAKIAAVINNARRAQELIAKEGSLAAFLWRFEPTPESVAPPQSVTTSPESVALSKELKKRGWKFVGPTTLYAFMQSMGIVNDHVHGCALRSTIDDARSRFDRPSV